jgi:hypothetical protein
MDAAIESLRGPRPTGPYEWNDACIHFTIADAVKDDDMPRIMHACGLAIGGRIVWLHAD